MVHRSMPNTVNAFVVPPDGGVLIPGPVGAPARILTRTETTSGGMATLVVEIPPAQGPPEHVHAREDEAHYVLEGAFRVKLDGEYFDATTGSLVFIPRGSAHCFVNVGDSTARLLVTFAPSGMERFFEGAAGVPPGSEEYRALARSAWMEVVGPPLTLDDGA